MTIPVLFYIFVAFTAIQIGYYIFFSSFLFSRKKTKLNSEKVPVSVIIFAKNSAAFLHNYLPSILAQDYFKFEVVLINNESDDDTATILEDFRKQYQAVKIIDVKNNEAFWNNKKYALTLGIKAAKYDHLLFTEANCKPISKHWISAMAANFSDKKSIVLGYRKFEKQHSLSNLIFRFNNLLEAVKCFSFSKAGYSVMAFSANLGFNRADFFRVKGFINHIHIRDAEFDLFIKDASTKKNTTYTILEASFTEKNNHFSFSEWFFEQRKLFHLKKHVNLRRRILLAFFIISKLLWYLLAIILFFFYPFKTLLFVVLLYFLVQFVVIGFSSKKLKEPLLIFFIPFLDLSLLLIQISIFIANLVSKPNHWK